MSHWRYQPGDLLIENRYGIPEPKQRHLSLESEFFDVIIVPVLAMDIYGNRLGYGKGYYDRFIATCRPNIITIGLHFFEPLADLPIEPNDMPLTYLVTPNKYYAF
jgi:5-formyltetrahydrofolate cyclo-ligase